LPFYKFDYGSSISNALSVVETDVQNQIANEDCGRLPTWDKILTTFILENAGEYCCGMYWAEHQTNVMYLLQGWAIVSPSGPTVTWVSGTNKATFKVDRPKNEAGRLRISVEDGMGGYDHLPEWGTGAHGTILIPADGDGAMWEKVVYRTHNGTATGNAYGLGTKFKIELYDESMTNLLRGPHIMEWR
jgi:hypothetical protein